MGLPLQGKAARGQASVEQKGDRCAQGSGTSLEKSRTNTITARSFRRIERGKSQENITFIKILMITPRGN